MCIRDRSYSIIIENIVDRPYDPVYFVNPGHHGEWCGVEYVFPYDNFPVNSVYHSNWLSTLSGLKFVFHWSQLPVYTDIVLSTDSINAVRNDPECFLLINCVSAIINELNISICISLLTS